ncbi:hypothetical protein Acid345_2105 [Candidatus Koribacter versatilis Ellin345]|uniref:DUF4136 domain-containing protein n=1 Tax=Koribacter versatilis (strain Ellin345) TaxID=204669 RepID=Q1IPU4_KORVE|nr:hypothetical protein [Candidatus Koribacter versatilis]ABF41106.1 hypothetical protein Acid345_2105 [Candidatus Koribacter versatilis Ellin345]
MVRRSLLAMAVLLFAFTSAIAQAPESKAPVLSPSARLAAAKTAYLKNAGGSEIPYNVISDGVEGWGRYKLVQDPTEADIIIEVMAPSSSNGVSVSAGTSSDQHLGAPAQSMTTSKELTITRITLIVYDARSKAALWSATEQPKSAMKAKTRQDNVVESAQRLLTKFRERVEPEPK